MEPLHVLLEVRVSLHVHFVLLEALLIEVACSLNVAVVVGTLGVLVKLEGTFATVWCIGAQESCGVLLKLSALRFHFKLVMAVEGSSILAVHS